MLPIEAYAGKLQADIETSPALAIPYNRRMKQPVVSCRRPCGASHQPPVHGGFSTSGQEWMTVTSVFGLAKLDEASAWLPQPARADVGVSID
jgi:hypothetical protein